MYGKAAKPKIRADELGVGLVASFFEASFEAAFNVGQNQLQIVTESRTPKVFLVEAILVLLTVVEGSRGDFMAKERATEKDPVGVVQDVDRKGHD